MSVWKSIDYFVPLPSVWLAFWKNPCRKLFAVIGKNRKRPIVLDSDDDNFEPTIKLLRTHTFSRWMHLNGTFVKLYQFALLLSSQSVAMVAP